MKIELTKNKNELLIPTKDWDFQNPPYDIEDMSVSMVDYMWSVPGATGLAGNQIGIPFKLFCIQGDPSFVCFNPKIVMPSDELLEMEEGSVSYPGFSYDKIRPKHIRIRFAAPDSQIYTKTFTGLTARVIQQLIDILNGIPIWDGISKLKFDMSIRHARKLGFDYSYLPYKKSSIIMP